MIKGRDLLGYAVNSMKGDKLDNLYTIAAELHDLNDITRRAISLINPVNQYSFLEDLIVNTENSEVCIKDFLESYGIKLPNRYGWRYRQIDTDGTENILDKDEWYEDKHQCYCKMFKVAMISIENAVDCCHGEEINITTTETSIQMNVYGMTDIFEIYEME